jgi:hypothetical protein
MAQKWISKRIESLDPEVDYDEIWKLSTAYRPHDFMMNLVYAVTFPHFLIREVDAAPLYNDGNGKIFTKPDKRADDTSWKMQLWWHYGSRSEETRRNVESINKLHEYYAAKYPESFARPESYIYPLCYEAAGMHRLLRRVGLPGLSAVEKRAAVKFWTNMAQHFRIATTGEGLPEFPRTFEGIEAYMDDFESQEVPFNVLGRASTEAIIKQFAERYFPRPLRPLVRLWVISLYPEHVIRIHDIRRPPAPVVRAFRLLTAAMFVVGEKVAPDPTDTFHERREESKRIARGTRAVGQAGQAGDATATMVAPAATSACPHAAGDRTGAAVDV